jgi:hypothetical protein
VVGWKELTYIVVPMLVFGDYIEHSSSKVHHAEAVLEATVSGAGINEISQRQLMDVPETLKGSRVDDLSLVRGDTDEGVNRVSELMLVLRRRHAGDRTAIQNRAPYFHLLWSSSDLRNAWH